MQGGAIDTYPQSKYYSYAKYYLDTKYYLELQTRIWEACPENESLLAK